MIFPWQQELWARLVAQRSQERLPHGILIAGAPGVGKQELAQHLSAALLCSSPTTNGDACGVCRSCRFLASGVHPDFLSIQPEDGGKTIAVDQIRQLAAFVSLTRQQAPTKVVLITPADRMNINAANSLLKTLEEPTPQTVLILVTAHPLRLPATVRSRCQRYDVIAPSSDLTRAWLREQLGSAADVDLLLALSGGMPCAARALAQGDALATRDRAFACFSDVWEGRVAVVDGAAVYAKLDAETALTWMIGWLTDMARLRVDRAPPRVQNPDLNAAMVSLAQRVELSTLIEQEQSVRNALRLARGQANLQLLWEQLFGLLARSGGQPRAQVG